MRFRGAGSRAAQNDKSSPTYVAPKRYIDRHTTLLVDQVRRYAVSRSFEDALRQGI